MIIHKTFRRSWILFINQLGPDAKAAVDWIFTNKMDGPVGKTVYTCMLNKMAGIEADLTVSVIESGSGGAADPKVILRCGK